MSRIWGPLGWMTLHSISLNYPENPSGEDKSILFSFMRSFAESITCPSCRSHFTNMFAMYKSRHPEWANSKFDLFLFIVRAHNTVNKRLDKPIIYTVADCIQTIVQNSKLTPLPVFRQNYINHVIRNYQRELTGEGRIRLGFIREVQKINYEYWNPREFSIADIVFPEANVTEFIEDNSRTVQNVFSSTNIVIPLKVGFRLTGGKLKLGTR